MFLRRIDDTILTVSYQQAIDKLETSYTDVPTSAPRPYRFMGRRSIVRSFSTLPKGAGMKTIWFVSGFKS